MTSQSFLTGVLENSYNQIILERLADLHLPQTYLTAGCLFQTHWNLAAQQDPTQHINDYDVFYFDNSDLSYEAEDAVICQAAELFADLDVRLELRNQARVHLWFKDRFAHESPQLTSSQHAIDRFLILGTCLGVTPQHEVYAPHGFADLENGILRANPINLTPELFARKVESYRRRWSWLKLA